MKTLKELADIGTVAVTKVKDHKFYGNLTIFQSRISYESDRIFREAFAQAVREAILADIAAAREGQSEAVDWRAKAQVMEHEYNNWKAAAADWRTRAEKSEADLKNAHQTTANYHQQSLASEDRATANLRKLEKAEVELACWHSELSAVMPPDFKDWHQNSKAEWPLVARQVIENLREREKLAWGNTISQLRPLSEACDVPDGCVRVLSWLPKCDSWCFSSNREDRATHFADIRLHKVPKTEPTPKTFTAHGIEWTTHKPGDAMPCDGDKIVHLIRGDEILDGGVIGRNWFWNDDKITGWRYADQPKTEPTPAYSGYMTGEMPAIKPWTLPTPLDGREWHRNDWTEDMLPAGWRPLLKGEVPVIGTDSFMFNGRWIVEDEGHVHLPMRDSDTHQRTRRPLPSPPTANTPAPWQPTVGDVVRLKSGGPAMTVRCFTPENAVVCDWFHRVGGDTDSKVFPAACLMSAEWKPCTKEAK